MSENSAEGQPAAESSSRSNALPQSVPQPQPLESIAPEARQVTKHDWAPYPLTLDTIRFLANATANVPELGPADAISNRVKSLSEQLTSSPSTIDVVLELIYSNGEGSIAHASSATDDVEPQFLCILLIRRDKNPVEVTAHRLPLHTGVAACSLQDLDAVWNFISLLFSSSRLNLISTNFKSLFRDIFRLGMGIGAMGLVSSWVSAAPSAAVLDASVAAWVYDPELDGGFVFARLLEFVRPLVGPAYFDQAEQRFLHKTPTKAKKGSSSQQSDPHFAWRLLDVYFVTSALFHNLSLAGPELLDAYFQVEGKIPRILACMEFLGVGFDSSILRASQGALQQRLNQLQHAADRSCGFPVAISSPKKLGEVLYKKLKLQPDTHKSAALATGGMSTSENVLKSMSKQHPLPHLILEFRQVQKMLTAWIEPLENFDVGGRICTIWNQIGTATGRLSSSSPNIQALPRGDNVIKLDNAASHTVNIRAAFSAPQPGWVLLGADYSQLEMRLMAHFSGDEVLISFFKSGQDIHTSVAAHWLKKDIQEVTKQERDNAKRLVYGIMYGIGSRSLADMLGISREEAQNFIKTFLEAYPAVNAFIKATIAKARAEGFVRTLSGRRRLLGVDVDDEELEGHSASAAQAKADRQAVNSIIQGTAADIAKIAMIQIQDELSNCGLSNNAHVLMQIHDELILQANPTVASQVLQIIVDKMESAANILVPLTVSPKAGYTWGQMKEVALPLANMESFVISSPKSNSSSSAEALIVEAFKRFKPSQFTAESLESTDCQSAIQKAKCRLALLERQLLTKVDKFPPAFLAAIAALSCTRIDVTASDVLDSDDDIMTAASKSGGAADLPAVWLDQYLSGDAGVIPTCVFQIDLSEIASQFGLLPDFLPSSGLLFVFASLDPSSGSKPEYSMRLWSGGLEPDRDLVRVPPSFGFEYDGPATAPMMAPSMLSFDLSLDLCTELLFEAFPGEMKQLAEACPQLLTTAARRSIGGFSGNSQEPNVVLKVPEMAIQFVTNQPNKILTPTESGHLPSCSLFQLGISQESPSLS